MSKYRCVFRNCSTINAPGKGVMPPACAAKGCTGNFDRKPGCKTFMQDALPPESIMGSKGFEFTQITRIEERFPTSLVISNGCKWYPTRAVVRA